MDDFASYSSNAGREEDGQTVQVPVDWEKEMKKIALRYNGRGEGEIIKEIFARAAEGKRNGTLTNEQIDAFYKQFAPALNGSQRKRLQKLVDQLKGT